MPRVRKSLLYLALVVFAASGLTPGVAWSTPTQVAQQGRLVDASDQPLAGDYDLSFTLYDDATGGSSLWTETQTVSLDEGYYAVTLGATEELDDLLFAGGALWLEVAVDGSALSPRQLLVAVPYSFRAGTSEGVDGGAVDADELSIGGNPVIDATGTWVGPTPSVSWSELSGIPSDIGDGDADTDTQLTDSEVDAYVENGPLTLDPATTLDGAAISTGAHTTDTTLAEEDVLTMVEGTAVDLAAGSTLDGAAFTSGPHTLQLTNSQVDAFVTNGPLNLAAGTLIANQAISIGAHTPDTQLDNAAVDAFVINGPLDLDAGTTLGTQTISTGAHTPDTQLDNAAVDAFVINGPLDLDAGTTLGTLAISTGAHTPDTQLDNAAVDAFVINGPLDLDAGTTLGTQTISTGAHIPDTQLNNAAVDAFVVDGPLDLDAGTTLGTQTISTGSHTVDTLANLSCTSAGERLEWNGSAWVCGPSVALPVGIIVMWSGSPANIPTGWALCDGTNGTPNLLGRFVRSIENNSSNPGATGGNDLYTLSTSEMPTHSHTTTDPGHSHATTKVCTSGSTQGLTGVVSANPCGSLGTTSTTTGLTINSTGGGQAFDNRPAYFEIAYIIKL